MFEEFMRLWKAMDHLVERYEEQPWGAVVTDPRFPAVHDANYARVDDASVPMAAVMDALLPAIEKVEAREIHIVMTNPDRSAELMTALSSAGHRLGWDDVMVHEGRPPEGSTLQIEDLQRDSGFAAALKAGIAAFGDASDALDQLLQLELEVFTQEVKTWRCVREDGEVAALAGLVMLEGIGYIDNVATLEPFRGKGYASALTADALWRARSIGAERCFLLVDPGGPVRLYERLGFKPAGKLASTLARRL